MGCSSCSSNSNGTPRGCKNNGTCGSDGCNKMTVFNWLSNMEIVSEKENSNIIEVRFKKVDVHQGDPLAGVLFALGLHPAHSGGE